jgi:hypothetical protein
MMYIKLDNLIYIIFFDGQEQIQLHAKNLLISNSIAHG